MIIDKQEGWDPRECDVITMALKTKSIIYLIWLCCLDTILGTNEISV